jgi:hypothetical protein
MVIEKNRIQQQKKYAKNIPTFIPNPSHNYWKYKSKCPVQTGRISEAPTAKDFPPTAF